MDQAIILYIDECAQTPNPCAYKCRNVPGSFRCVCPPGTVLLGDGRSCAGLERGHIFTNSTRHCLSALLHRH
uniref:EGF-like domain-containing protein n=1 Tax=Astyanax mexicanus TaxID=7994 RepID=A0A3B1KAB9_ASTMX